MNPGRAARLSKPDRLLNLLQSEFVDAHQASELFNEFLRHEDYSKHFCAHLMAVAKARRGVSWDLRRLAVLMLEHQVLKLSPDNLSDFDFLFAQLNLKSAPGEDKEIVSSVLKEGYSTTAFRPFIQEFRRKLERLNHVHQRIKGDRSSEIALLDFIRLSRLDCKLALSRYVFRPEEVVAQILQRLKTSGGVVDLDLEQPRYVETEVRRALSLLPDFEAAILKELCETSNIYWVSETTSSEINSLVEYPLTTVVLVVKPPGSGIEFEIKRAGRRGPNPLGIVYEHDGDAVPPSHRLDGGNMQWLLRYEAYGSLRLSLIYRQAQAAEAPISSHVSRSTIFYIPVRNVEEPLLSYFTESNIYGSRFRQMREALKESVEAFKNEQGATLPDLPGDLALTSQFVGFVAPAQSILIGTSSFRLDKLAAYLSDCGPEIYFREGLKVAYSKHDARRFADEILEEILGVYQPPDVNIQSFKQYLDAAFSGTENRQRADRIYLSLVQQIGDFWGTLLAVRGYSRGESFVARNVGLKSFWDDGHWKVKIIFMDHDALVIPDPQTQNFFAHDGLPNMALDERYIWGRSNPQRFATSAVGYLQNIYRINEGLGAEGQALAHKALKDAYRKTQNQMLTNPELQRLFNKIFVDRLSDWDTFVRGYFQTRRDASARAAWKSKMKKMLKEKGYRRDSFDAFIKIVENNKGFLEKYLFLFEPEGEG